MIRSQDAITFLHELASGVVEDAENFKAHAQAIAKATRGYCMLFGPGVGQH